MIVVKSGHTVKWGLRSPADLDEAVCQAIGAASMCWTEPSPGVFMPELALEIRDALMEYIKQHP